LPEKVISDGGPEFVGHEWEYMLMDWGIKKGRISSHTPTANAVVESSHRVMGQVLRTILGDEGKEINGRDQLIQAVDNALATTMRACRCAANTSLQGFSPGALVFGRDMHLAIPIAADIISISENRQLQTDARVFRENQRRTLHEYKVGDHVFVNNHFSSGDKLKPAWTGPFSILQVHTNGTVTVRRGQVHERISIRRVKPGLA
jgi:hypothetical protein